VTGRQGPTGAGPPPGTFCDQFARVAPGYARFRPRYPRALFQWIAAQADRRDAAWDCATGSGQAAVGLAQDFLMVTATDASEAQLAHATPHPRVAYRVAPADRSGLPDAAMDVVTVAQALHWLPRDAFYAEARRVLRPGGLLVVWGYHYPGVGEPVVDDAIRAFHDETVGPYWRPERQLVVDRFGTIAFPFDELDVPAFVIRQPMTLTDFGHFLRTLSATEHYTRARGEDPVPAFEALVESRWGGGEGSREVRWPMFLRAGRV
jgi:SAM-dependent methyltransferase